MSIRVRRHQRDLPSGKTTTVRQHERRGNPQEQPVPRKGSWWDGSDAEPPSAGDHPDGTWFFREDDDAYAVHPDGTVHPVSPQSDAEPAGDDPHGTGLPPEMAKLFGADSPAGAERYKRANALRESGYTGPIDQDGYAAPEEGPGRPAPNAALERMQDEMRHWRSLPEPTPRPDKPMNPQLARALGCDTPEGRARYDRGRAYREAGYRGPLNSANRIPDPDDPAEHEALSALAALSEI